MSRLLSSRWASKPDAKSSVKLSEDKEITNHVSIPSFGFQMPVATPIAKSPLGDVPTSSPGPPTSFNSRKDPAQDQFTMLEPSPPSLMSLEVKDGHKPLSKADIAGVAARNRMIVILGQHYRRSLPYTTTETIGNDLSASYGGYSKDFIDGRKKTPRSGGVVENDLLG